METRPGGASPDIEPGPVITLPEPCLVLLVGAAGAGKSTLAARLFEPGEVLSSDAYREIVTGDPTDQGATRAAFAILHRELGRRMARGRTTVVDATNVTAFARRSLVRRATSHGVSVVAIVLELEPALVLARNATRSGRIVPEPAVRAQLRDLARSIRRGALEGEGYTAVHHLRTPQAVGALVIVRGQADERRGQGEGVRQSRP